MSPDRSQVGLTDDADRKLLELRESTPYFGDEADVYRLGVAVGLALGSAIPDRLRQATFTTKFRTTRTDDSGEVLPRLDSVDGRLAQMVSLFYPEAADEPYRFSQYLATIGINHLHGELVTRRRSLSEVLGELADSALAEGDESSANASEAQN